MIDSSVAPARAATAFDSEQWHWRAAYAWRSILEMGLPAGPRHAALLAACTPGDLVGVFDRAGGPFIIDELRAAVQRGPVTLPDLAAILDRHTDYRSSRRKGDTLLQIYGD